MAIISSCEECGAISGGDYLRRTEGNSVRGSLGIDRTQSRDIGCSVFIGVEIWFVVAACILLDILLSVAKLPFKDKKGV